MIDITKEGGLWRLTINRPAKANSLTGEMLAEMLDLVVAAKAGPRVLVITGTGNVFSAGADLQQASAGLATSKIWEQLSSAIADLPCLSIAALNGTLAGGAFGMALACDLRIAVQPATFFYPVMQLGFLPQPSDPARLVALVGPARAKMILMAGQKITASEALSWGLVDRLTSGDALENTVQELAAVALAASGDHVAAIKQMIPRT